MAGPNEWGLSPSRIGKSRAVKRDECYFKRKNWGSEKRIAFWARRGPSMSTTSRIFFAVLGFAACAGIAIAADQIHDQLITDNPNGVERASAFDTSILRT